MKKIILILAIIGYAVHAHATNVTVKKDSLEIKKKLNDLNSKLTDLNTQLSNIQTQLPTDSAKYQGLLSKSLDEQKKSKDYAKDAVGGDVGDANKAARQAKKPRMQLTMPTMPKNNSIKTKKR